VPGEAPATPFGVLPPLMKIHSPLRIVIFIMVIIFKYVLWLYTGGSGRVLAKIGCF
jgi:hypothetical protein